MFLTRHDQWLTVNTIQNYMAIPQGHEPLSKFGASQVVNAYHGVLSVCANVPCCVSSVVVAAEGFGDRPTPSGSKQSSKIKVHPENTLCQPVPSHSMSFPFLCLFQCNSKLSCIFPVLWVSNYPYPKLSVSPNSLFSKVWFPLIDRLPHGRKPKKSSRTEIPFARRWSFKGGNHEGLCLDKTWSFFDKIWSQTASMLSAKTWVGCVAKTGWLRIGAKLNPVLQGAFLRRSIVGYKAPGSGKISRANIPGGGWFLSWRYGSVAGVFAT